MNISPVKASCSAGINDNPSLLFTLLIVCLSIGGLLSSDIMLPAITPMSIFYKTTAHEIQVSISIFLFGISFSQLFYGPLSDGLGRKRILLFGVALWFIATTGILFVSKVNELFALRLLQGIGACAGITISRAIIADIFDRDKASSFYLTIFPFVGLSPALAPLLGGFLTNFFGWKACFIFLATFSFITLLLCFFFLSESLPKEKRNSINPKSLLNNISSIIIDRNFLYWAAIPCIIYATYFGYLVEAPLIYTKLGLPISNIGYTFLTLSVAYVSGNLIAKRILKRLGIKGTIRVGYTIVLLGAALFALQMYISPIPIYTSILTISIFTFGNGILLPLGIAQAIASRADLSGTASGVMGFLQLGSAAISSCFIGVISRHQPEVTATIIFLLAAIGFVIYLLRANRIAVS